MTCTFDPGRRCARRPRRRRRLGLHLLRSARGDAGVACSGGPGDDKLQASFDGQPTTLDGGPGNDKLDGGTGTDTLIGGDGDDSLDGKAGTDPSTAAPATTCSTATAQDPSPDVIDGGAGYDRIDPSGSSRYNAPPVPLTVTLGGGADDGRPGEGDDVRNVERSSPSARAAWSAPTRASISRSSRSRRRRAGRRRGGNDTLKGADGPDKLDGGAGDDDLDAGFGDDVIVGGPGRDSIAGDRRGGDCGPLWCKYPFGNDTIDARDGEQDSVMCGAGAGHGAGGRDRRRRGRLRDRHPRRGGAPTTPPAGGGGPRALPPR